MRKLKEPIMYEATVQSSTGCMVYLKFYSRVVTLCKKNGNEVMAVRYDDCTNWLDVQHAVKKDYPDWNIKSARILYEDDFKA